MHLPLFIQYLHGSLICSSFATFLSFFLLIRFFSLLLLFVAQSHSDGLILAFLSSSSFLFNLFFYFLHCFFSLSLCFPSKPPPIRSFRCFVVGGFFAQFFFCRCFPLFRAEFTFQRKFLLKCIIVYSFG